MILMKAFNIIKFKSIICFLLFCIVNAAWSQGGKSLDKWTPKMQAVLDEIVTVHKTLNPDLFEIDKTLKPEIREQALKVGLYFFDKTKLPRTGLKDIVMVGSMTGYGYTKESDIDIQLVIKSTEYKCKYIFKFWNETFQGYKIQFLDYPAQVGAYADKSPLYGPVYSLIKDKWLTKPRVYRLSYSKNQIKQKTLQLINHYEKVKHDYLSSSKKNDCRQLIAFRKILRTFREIGFRSKHAELSLENMTYRLFSHLGLISDLYKLKKQCIENQLSFSTLP